MDSRSRLKYFFDEKRLDQKQFILKLLETGLAFTLNQVIKQPYDAQQHQRIIRWIDKLEAKYKDKYATYRFTLQKNEFIKNLEYIKLKRKQVEKAKQIISGEHYALLKQAQHGFNKKLRELQNINGELLDALSQAVQKNKISQREQQQNKQMKILIDRLRVQLYNNKLQYQLTQRKLIQVKERNQLVVQQLNLRKKKQQNRQNKQLQTQQLGDNLKKYKSPSFRIEPRQKSIKQIQTQQFSDKFQIYKSPSFRIEPRQKRIKQIQTQQFGDKFQIYKSPSFRIEPRQKSIKQIQTQQFGDKFQIYKSPSFRIEPRQKSIKQIQTQQFGDKFQIYKSPSFKIEPRQKKLNIEKAPNVQIIPRQKYQKYTQFDEVQQNQNQTQTNRQPLHIYHQFSESQNRFRQKKQFNIQKTPYFKVVGSKQVEQNDKMDIYNQYSQQVKLNKPNKQLYIQNVSHIKILPTTNNIQQYNKMQSNISKQSDQFLLGKGRKNRRDYTKMQQSYIQADDQGSNQPQFKQPSNPPPGQPIFNQANFQFLGPIQNILKPNANQQTYIPQFLLPPKKSPVDFYDLLLPKKDQNIQQILPNRKTSVEDFYDLIDLQYQQDKAYKYRPSQNIQATRISRIPKQPKYRDIQVVKDEIGKRVSQLRKNIQRDAVIESKIKTNQDQNIQGVQINFRVEQAIQMLKKSSLQLQRVTMNTMDDLQNLRSLNQQFGLLINSNPAWKQDYENAVRQSQSLIKQYQSDLAFLKRVYSQFQRDIQPKQFQIIETPDKVQFKPQWQDWFARTPKKRVQSEQQFKRSRKYTKQKSQGFDQQNKSDSIQSWIGRTISKDRQPEQYFKTPLNGRKKQKLQGLRFSSEKKNDQDSDAFHSIPYSRFQKQISSGKKIDQYDEWYTLGFQAKQ